MNVVTIMNYPDVDNYNKMCKIFIDRVKLYNPECNLFIIHKNDLPSAVSACIKTHTNVKTLRLEQDTECWYDHHNVNFKLYNLTRVDQPFIFIDADIFCFSALDHLWSLKDEQPFIGVNHQYIPGHTTTDFKFLNSGVQVVGDPDWYKYSNFRDAYQKCSGRLKCKGFDQAHIFTYCEQIGYDYTHPEVGYGWNSCAKYGIVKILDETSVCTYDAPSADPEPSGYDVKLNHYWWDFKPWQINCPIYNNYECN